jgi:hypothetical protein
MLANDLTGQLARERVADSTARRNGSASWALPGPNAVAATAAGGVGGTWRVRAEPRVRASGSP